MHAIEPALMQLRYCIHLRNAINLHWDGSKHEHSAKALFRNKLDQQRQVLELVRRNDAGDRLFGRNSRRRIAAALPIAAAARGAVQRRVGVDHHIEAERALEVEFERLGALRRRLRGR